MIVGHTPSTEYTMSAWWNPYLWRLPAALHSFVIHNHPYCIGRSEESWNNPNLHRSARTLPRRENSIPFVGFHVAFRGRGGDG